jgi:hypothetical protein
MLGTWVRLSEDERQYYNGDFDAYLKEFEDAANAAMLEFDAADKVLRKYTNGVSTLNDNFNAENAKAYSDAISQLAIGVSDPKKIEDFNASINALAGQLPEEEFNTFMSQLTAIDMSDLNAWE